MSAQTDLFIGIMSGTSLDGIDVVLARFPDKVDFIAHESFSFDPGVRELLYEAATATDFNLNTFARLHFLLADLYADAVKQTLSRHTVSKDAIAAIGLHGQTVRHLPTASALIRGLPEIRATIQLGSGSAVAALTGIDVVSDFRSADVALGGQGAPLVPMFDAVFLRDDLRDRATLNIGGIANITILPSRSSNKPILAYDTGPGNMLIDELTRRFFNKPYDEDGKIAASGSANKEVLTELLLDDFFSAPAPKLTGRELFGGRFLALLTSMVDQERISAVDAVTTASELTARSAALDLVDWNADLIVSGGGAYNLYLLRRLQELLPNCRVTTSTEFGIPSQAKEALAFAYFAKAFLNNEKIHLPETTGASHKLILGSLAKGK